jgi:hypothetical protein
MVGKHFTWNKEEATLSAGLWFFWLNLLDVHQQRFFVLLTQEGSA